MKDRRPCVSICLPVYNGEDYISEAIDSIRAQTFDDYEVIISDNASTDGTPKICRAFAMEDPRVKFYRADINQGLAWNMNRALSLANGRYVMWICHDDRMQPDYIERCVEILKKEKDTILCFANCYYINAEGQILERVDLPDTGAGETPSGRFGQVLYNWRCDPINGLMKVEFLRQTRLHAAYADSDRVLLAEMALRGRFYRIPAYLFSKRIHASQTTAEADRWERTFHFDPKKVGALVCPWWHELFGFVGGIWRAPIDYDQRLRAYKLLYWWVLVQRTCLYRDLQRAFKCVIGYGS